MIDDEERDLEDYRVSEADELPCDHIGDNDLELQSGNIEYNGENALYIHNPNREVSETNIVSTAFVDLMEAR